MVSLSIRLAIAIFLLAMASFSAASVTMTYPLKAFLEDGSSIDAGFASPGQTFDIVFSDDSGADSDWDAIEISTGQAGKPSIPAGWKLVSTQHTDTSLVASISVPPDAQPNIYILRASLSRSAEPILAETVQVRVVVKRGLIDVAFAKKSLEDFQYVGGKAIYSAKITNSSIAPARVTIMSTLPNNWSSTQSVEVKPSSSQDLELSVLPLSSGRQQFSFRAFTGEDSLVVQSYSSELNVRPTLRGKLVAPFSGFPFFTFALLPFQLFNSFIGLALP